MERQPQLQSSHYSVPYIYMLDFYPVQDEKQTQLVPFFKNLKEGKLSTTTCSNCGILWPPRIVCPSCNRRELKWTTLPDHGKIYAFSEVRLGIPLGMEKEAPLIVGMVEFPEHNLKIFTRIDDISPNECKIGLDVKLKIINLPDGRVFYRFTKI